MDNGFSNVRHGKWKVDQETQSPLLKIFKDVMLKEASDQEKISLLSDRPDENKRNQYSTQGDTTLLAVPSMRREPMVQAQKKDSKKVTSKKSDRKLEKSFAKQFEAFCAGSKRKEKESKNYCMDPKCSADDTFSCHSCAFKKFMLRDYTLPCAVKLPGFAIVLLLLLIVLYLASGSCKSYCYNIGDWFKHVNEANEDSMSFENTEPVDYKRTGEEGVQEGKGARNVEVGLVDRLKDVVGYKEGLDPKSYSDISMQNDLSVASDRYESPSGSFGGMSYLNNLENNFRAGENKELDRIFRKSKDFRNNDSLQHFYKKLLATDAQIQKLKKSQGNYYDKNLNTNLNANYYPRYKRSLWNFKRPFVRFRHAKSRKDKKTSDLSSLNATLIKTEFPTTITREQVKELNRNRRNIKAIRKLRQISFNVHDDPSKIFIQKKNILVKVHPAENDRRSKCTHVMSDSKSHEKNLKHPFYKNSQRLDELLDQLLDKNLNNVPTDTLQEDALSKQNHNMQDKGKKGPEAEESNVFTTKSPMDNVLGRLFKNKFKKVHETKRNKGGSKLPIPLDEFLMNGGKLSDDSNTSSTSLQTSTTTESPQGEKDQVHEAHDSRKSLHREPAVIIVPHQHRTSNLRHLLQSDDAYDSSLYSTDGVKASNLRHLLQSDDDYDGSLHYTDGKEVLSDDLEPHDDMEKRRERAVGGEGNPAGSSQQIVYTNPNWKGPIPLYFEEIRDMFPALPAPKGQKGGKERQLRSTEKFEDYDSRDAEAQAYSDYGVLEGKKYSQATESTEITDILSKYNFKRDLQAQVASGPNTSGDRQKAKNKFLAAWSGRFGKLTKVKPDEMQDDADISESLYKPESMISTNKTKETEPKKSNVFKSRSLMALSFRSRVDDDGQVAGSPSDDDGDEDDDDEENDERKKRKENSPAKIASFKIIRKREADAPTFQLVDKTKNFNESDHLLSILSQWFANMAVAANGSDCREANKDGQQSSASPTTESNEYSQITQHSKQNLPYFSRPDSWKPRSLLSIKEEKEDGDKVTNNTEAVSDGGVGKNRNDTKDEAKIETIPNNLIKTTLTTIAVGALNATETLVTKEDKKPVVKRSAPVDEKGLTFWNDLYDDEYGVQVDSVNEPMGTARAANLDLSKNPKNWFRQKYRSFKNMVHDKRSDARNIPAGIRMGRDANEDGGSAKPTYDIKTSPETEDTPTILKTYTTEKPISFEELTVKMKNVVSQAAKAVEETNTARAPTTLPAPDIEANDTESDVGSSLMRQLMRMMSDVMDYQVHARTCLQPPEDLRVFLVQLTAPDPGRRLRDVDGEDMGYRSDEGYISDDEILSPNPTDLHISQAREQDNSRDIKNDCEDTLRTVESLMMEYDMLSDEEKKTMIGAKEYLQNQLDFLRTQCSSHSDFSFDLTPYYQDNMPVQRVKRQVYKGDSIKKTYVGKHKKNIGRIMKFWSTQPKTTSEAGSLITDSSEETFKDSIRSFYVANDKLQAAKHTYDLGMKQLSDLEFKFDGQNDKSNVKILNALQKGLINADNTYNKNLTKYTVPPKAEDLDSIFEMALLDPSFRDSHKINVVHFNEAKRQYEKSLGEYQAAKERFDKSTCLYNQHREEFERSIKQMELAKKIYRASAVNLKKAYDKFANPKKRNLYDVYYRAVSEAKKLTATTESATSSYGHTTEVTTV